MHKDSVRIYGIVRRFWGGRNTLQGVWCLTAVACRTFARHEWSIKATSTDIYVANRLIHKQHVIWCMRIYVRCLLNDDMWISVNSVYIDNKIYREGNANYTSPANWPIMRHFYKWGHNSYMLYTEVESHWTDFSFHIALQKRDIANCVYHANRRSGKYDYNP